MAYGGRSYRGYDARFDRGYFSNKPRGRGSFRSKFYTEAFPKYRNRGGYYTNPHSRFAEDEGFAVSDTHGTRPRFNPYGRGRNRRDDRQGRDRGSYHGNNSRDSSSHDRAETNEDNKQWFKVTIPHGTRYDKGWLIGRMQSACAVPFTPVGYFCDHSRAHFYVNDSTVSKSLRQLSRTFTDKDKFSITILTRPCSPPVLKMKLTDKEIHHFKNCMQKRYDGSQQSLNMKSLRTDPDLIANKVDLILGRKYCMEVMLKIIEENVPELLSLDLSNNKLNRLDNISAIHAIVPNLKILNLSGNTLKTDKELDKVKGLKLEMLWLQGNPLCNSFQNQNAYISAMRERFPKLLRLDGHELPPPISFDVETPTTLPPCKGSYLVTAEIKGLVLRFLRQYFTCYDSEDRQGLLNTYHDEACCSLSIPNLSGQNSSGSGLEEYSNFSRNLKTLHDPTLRRNLLKRKLNIVSFLSDLPRTQHDLNSFIVDITAYSNTSLSFMVNGVFKELGGPSSETIRAFTRTFIAVPVNDGVILLVNDQQSIRNATTEEIRKAFATPAPTSSSSPTLEQDAVQSFSQFSGMNADWSKKCLQDNDWDFEQAAQVFTRLKTEGAIPDLAFIQ